VSFLSQKYYINIYTNIYRRKKMQKDDLKCKLEQIASSMGYEVRKKIDEELSPIHRLFNILIIFGFLTVFIIMGSFVSTIYICTHKVEKRIERIEKIKYKNIVYCYPKEEEFYERRKKRSEGI
jgi:hypothetical protein